MKEFGSLDELEIGGKTIKKGARQTIEITLARLYDYTELSLPVEVIRGKESGPVMFMTGAIHGDELIGTAIIQQVLKDRRLKSIKGTLIAIPIVNVFGFNLQSRYLPDRRDLNRCFPGNAGGSMASRIAYLLVDEVIQKCDYGIDFHSGAIHRANLPQIRVSFQEQRSAELAEVFGAPVILNSKMREGSLRMAAEEAGVATLLFEGGEALRVDPRVLRSGVGGAFRILEAVGMLEPGAKKERFQSARALSSAWLRASQSGMIALRKGLGQKVKEGAILAIISDAFGRNSSKILAPKDGIIIGMTNLPLVSKGDAVFHLATFDQEAMDHENSEDLADFYHLYAGY